MSSTGECVSQWFASSSKVLKGAIGFILSVGSLFTLIIIVFTSFECTVIECSFCPSCAPGGYEPVCPFSRSGPQDNCEKLPRFISSDNNISAFPAGYCYEVTDENGDNRINRHIVPGNMCGSIVLNHQTFYAQIKRSFHVL